MFGVYPVTRAALGGLCRRETLRGRGARILGARSIVRRRRRCAGRGDGYARRRGGPGGEPAGQRGGFHGRVVVGDTRGQQEFAGSFVGVVLGERTSPRSAYRGPGAVA